VAVVRRRTRNVSLLFVVWIIVGIVVAASRNYLTAGLLRSVLSVILAILLWPLVLLGINLHL
jgi:predicted PurR-regulated permease PerM